MHIPQVSDSWDFARARRFRGLVTALSMVVVLSSCSLGGSSDSQGAVTSQNAEIAQSEDTVQPTPFTLRVDTPVPTHTPTISPTVEATAAGPPSPVVIPSERIPTVDALLASQDGVYGVVILDQNGAYLYARNADVPFIAASLYKLVLLADIYAKVETGALSLDMAIPLLPEYFDSQFAEEDGYYLLEDEGTETSLESALFGAGAYSSNIAAQALLDQTSVESLRATAETLGMLDTWFNVAPSEDIPGWPNRFLDDNNPYSERAVAFIDEQAEFNRLHITTPNDVAHYWYLLATGEVVSADASAAILEILRQQVVTDRIPFLLPEGFVTANKTGNLYHVVHDSGLISGPDGAVIVAALSQDEPDDDLGAQIIQRVGLAAVGIYDLPSFTADHFSPPESPEANDVSQ
ncbi:MAG: serine hydrolase [Thermomicrobiales bacterium]